MNFFVTEDSINKETGYLKQSDLRLNVDFIILDSDLMKTPDGVTLKYIKILTKKAEDHFKIFLQNMVKKDWETLNRVFSMVNRSN